MCVGFKSRHTNVILNFFHCKSIHYNRINGQQHDHWYTFMNKNLTCPEWNSTCLDNLLIYLGIMEIQHEYSMCPYQWLSIDRQFVQYPNPKTNSSITLHFGGPTFQLQCFFLPFVVNGWKFLLSFFYRAIIFCPSWRGIFQ